MSNLNPMYEAFLKAAGNDPQKIQMVNDARAANIHQAKVIKLLDEEKARKRAEAEKKAKEEAERMKEIARRAKEVEIVSNLYPFGYTYAHFGTYSTTCGIVFARDEADALNKIREEIQHMRETSPYKNDGWWVDWISNEKNLHIRIEPLDLSKGITTINTWIE